MKMIKIFTYKDCPYLSTNKMFCRFSDVFIPCVGRHCVIFKDLRKYYKKR